MATREGPLRPSRSSVAEVQAASALTAHAKNVRHASFFISSRVCDTLEGGPSCLVLTPFTHDLLRYSAAVPSAFYEMFRKICRALTSAREEITWGDPHSRGRQNLCGLRRGQRR